MSKISKSTMPPKKLIQPVSKTVVTTKKEIYRVPNQGKMVMKGEMKGICFSGHGSDKLGDALSFYIENNITNKALISATEGYRFNELVALSKHYSYEKANSIVTKFFNLLAFLAVKNVNIVNFPLTLAVCDFIRSGSRDFNKYLTCVYLLSESYKSRLPTVLNYAFLDEFGRKEAEDWSIQTNLIEGETFDTEDKFNIYLRDFIKAETKVNENAFSEDIINHIVFFRVAIENKNINEAFNRLYEINKTFRVPKEKKNTDGKIITKIQDLTYKTKINIFPKGKSYTTQNAYALLWRALEDWLIPEAYEILASFYFEASETTKKYYLYNAILASIFNIDSPILNLDEYIGTCTKNSTDLLSGVYELDISDYEEYLQEFQQASEDKFIMKSKNIPKEFRYRSRINLLPLSKNYENDHLNAVYFDVGEDQKDMRNKVE